MKNKFIIIVTGKSGSGKTTFSNFLSNYLDAHTINFDVISHQSLEDENIKRKLIDFFGEKIILNGKIDRKILGKIVFNDKDKLNYLNNICVKYIEDNVNEIIKTSTKKYIILEYALLTEMKYYSEANYKILLRANQNIRFERILKRDNISMEYLANREANSIDYNLAKFDAIIDNNANISQNLQNNAEKIAKKIQTLKN